MTYVVDANAMIAVLNNEPGADVVEQLLTPEGTIVYAHAVNICEVFYGVLRATDEATAQRHWLTSRRLVSKRALIWTIRFGKTLAESKRVIVFRWQMALPWHWPDVSVVNWSHPTITNSNLWHRPGFFWRISFVERKSKNC